jgi:anti-sigma-K factor RskA
VRLTRAGRIVSAPSVSSVLLAGLEATPQAQGSTFVDPSARAAVFYASDLPALSGEQTYQLWFIADGVPVSGGTFDVDAEGRAMVIVDQTAPIEAIQLWAVTIEPAGGVPQPTGEMVLKS